MEWKQLTEVAQLEEVDRLSVDRPVLLFKHSTRCNISSAARARLERAWTPVDDRERIAYFLDLLRHRGVSDAIAARYGVEHASPQALIIKQGKCTEDRSHFDITYADVISGLQRA